MYPSPLRRYATITALALALHLLSSCNTMDGRTMIAAAASGSGMTSEDQREVFLAALKTQPERRFWPSFQLGGKLKLQDGLEIDNEKSFGHAVTGAVAITGLVQNGLTERAKSADTNATAREGIKSDTTLGLDGGVTTRHKESEITKRMLIE
jgi:hypothetical protein